MTSLLFIDLETRSSVNLREEGGRRYAAHPSTEILTVAWSHEGRESVWIPSALAVPQGLASTQLPGVQVYCGRQCPVPSGHTLVAHNATGFDKPVWEKCVRSGSDEWLDAEPYARASGLPGGLDNIGKRLRGAGKIQDGKSRMLKYSRTTERFPGIGDLVKIAAYCLDDVRILVEEWRYVQERPFPEFEQRALAVHQVVNERGMRVDLDLCQRLSDLSEISTARTVAEIADLTNGELKDLKDLGSRTKVFAWVAGQNAKVGKSLAKDALDTLFREHGDESVLEHESGEETVLTPLVKKVLTLRQSAMRISGAKAVAAQKAAFRGRLHDVMVYYGAHTGRDTGRKFQPLNLPRPKPGVDVWKMFDAKTPGEIEAAIASTVADMKAAGKWEEKYAYPTLSDGISAMLRGVIIPDDGYYFAAGDYTAIEGKVLRYVCGGPKSKMLDVFREKRCIYMELSPRMFGRVMTNKKDPQRQILKVIELGSGYMMGVKTFGEYALANDVDLEANGLTAQMCVDRWRDAYPEISGVKNANGYREGGFWKELDWSAKKALKNGRCFYKCFKFFYDGRDLRCLMPSGRSIYYPNPKIETVRMEWGEADSIRYDSARGFRNFLSPGKLTENLVQGYARDLLVEHKTMIEAEGIPIILTVYDEIVAQVSNDKQARRVAEIMVTPPIWAPDFPLGVELDTMPRYSKNPPKGWASHNLPE